MTEREPPDKIAPPNPSADEATPEQPAAAAPVGSLRRLLKNSGIYALGGVGLKLMTALLAPIYTVILAPEDFGVWGLGSMLITGLMLAFNPALHGAVTRFYFDHEQAEAERRRFQGTIFTFLVVWSLFLAGVLTLIGPWLFAQLFDGLPFDVYGHFIIWTCVFSVLAVVPQATWTASEDAGKMVLINLATTTTNLVTAVGLVVLARVGVIGLFWARMLAVMVVAWPYLRFAKQHIQLTFDRKLLGAALAFSLPLVPHLLAHWVLAMSDRYLIERLMGISMVGIYASGYVFIDATNLVATSMNRAWVPQFTRAYGDPAQHDFIARSVTWFVFMLLIAVVSLGLLSAPLIRLFFNARYHEAAELTPILVFGGFFQGIYYLYVAVLFFRKRNGVVPILTVLGGTANVLLNLLWIPTYGLVGAAWATVVGYLVLAFGMRFAANRMGGLPVQTARVAVLVGWGVLVAAVGLLVGDSTAPLWQLLLRLGVLIAGALGIYALPFFTDEERTRIRAMLRGLLAKVGIGAR